ncbi:hypothetical protein PPROV_000670900 [Pycnococcus provasolii]|uniref:ABC-2 type transporter transmembrane domain-containing protein n=1 Tax=Pycnococcus provasolii TaxID=41880 RepID=A0A830HSP4_9CHLO|nr:hypothetical protein PPROV_000670900 [Pycnococcus provasolii]
MAADNDTVPHASLLIPATAYELRVTPTVVRHGVTAIRADRTTSFELTHHLILMHGGEVCFDGESSDVVSQLEFALAKTIPPRTNTADWLMDVLTNDEDGVNAAAAWRRTKAKDSMDNLAEVAGPIDDDDVVVEAMEAKHASSPKSAVNATVTAVVEMGLLFRRALIQQRGTSLTFANLVSTAFATLWSACFWFNLDGRTTAKLFERRSLLFFMLISQANAIVIASVNAFASERVILTRDKAKGLYRTSTYFIAKTLSDGMNILIMPLFYAVMDRVGISSALCRMPGEQECAIAYGDDVVRSMYMHEESWPIGKPTVGAGPGRRGHAVEVGECWKTRGPVGRREGRGEEEGPASQAVRSCPLLTLRTTSALIRDRSQDPGQGREGDDAPRDALDHLIHLVQLRPFKVTSPSSRTHW